MKVTSMKFEKFNIKFFCVLLGLVGFVFPAVLGLSFFIGIGFKKNLKVFFALDHLILELSLEAVNGKFYGKLFQNFRARIALQ